MNKKYYWLIAAFLILGLGVWGYQKKSSTQLQAQPKKDKVTEAVYGLGVVKATRSFDFKPSLAYQIKKIEVTEGQKVVKGQKLVELELGPTVKAPFNGVVTRLPFKDSENVFPQSLVIRVEDLSQPYVEVAVEQSAAMRIKTKQNVILSFDSDRVSQYQGLVESIYPNESQFIVRIKPLDQMPENILPGMTVDIVIEVGQKSDALLIPLTAVNQGRVTRIRNQKKDKIEIKTGLRSSEWIEVLEGDILLSDKVLLSKPMEKKE